MSTAGDTSTPVTVHVKGPSGLKLSLEIDLEITVLQMKERIEHENKDFPADRYVMALVLMRQPAIDLQWQGAQRP